MRRRKRRAVNNLTIVQSAHALSPPNDNQPISKPLIEAEQLLVHSKQSPPERIMGEEKSAPAIPTTTNVQLDATVVAHINNLVWLYNIGRAAAITMPIDQPSTSSGGTSAIAKKEKKEKWAKENRQPHQLQQPSTTTTTTAADMETIRNNLRLIRVAQKYQ